MKIKENKFTTKNNELLSTKTDLKLTKMPTNYMENLKKSVAGMITALDKPGVREGLLAEAQRLNAIEERKTEINIVYNQLITKPNMQEFQSKWIKNRANELVEKEDLEGLEQLNKGIDFSDKGGLIVHTKLGDIKFGSQQPTYGNLARIKGLQLGINVWSKNEKLKAEGLWVNLDALEKITNVGYRICNNKEYEAAANVFPGGKALDENNNRSKKLVDLFDLIGVKQYGVRGSLGGIWCNDTHRFLRSSNWNQFVSADDREGQISWNPDEKSASPIRFCEKSILNQKQK